MLSDLERVTLIRQYGQPYDVFVETGTAGGFTVIRLVNDFKRLVTIELDYDRYVVVAAREFMLQNTNILPLFGDSTRVLPEVLSFLNESAVFWLDAHYVGSGVRGEVDSPADTELEMILKWSKNNGLDCAVLIDDARFFGHDPGWPTMFRLERLAKDYDRQFVLQDDVIRVT